MELPIPLMQEQLMYSYHFGIPGMQPTNQSEWKSKIEDSIHTTNKNARDSKSSH